MKRDVWSAAPWTDEGEHNDDEDDELQPCDEDDDGDGDVWKQVKEDK